MSEPLGKCGRFTLARKIGSGGMGEIFLAHDPDGAPVAIKRLLGECSNDPVFVGMFLDEARLVERMDHPNVCRVHEHGMEGMSYFLVMDYVEGKSLAQLIQQKGALPMPLACRVAAQVAGALDYAHRMTDQDGEPMGIVHRDVSPVNVMVSSEGRVKLLDFGLAKARTQLMKTAPGLVKGKFGYLAPEQLAGTVDWRADVFALGLCLYEMLTGKQLFDQKTAAATVQAIRTFRGPPVLSGSIAGVTASLDEVLAKALSPRPRDRYESAAAFRAALAEVVREGGHRMVGPAALAELVKDPPPAPRPSSRPPKRRISPLAIIGVALAALAALVLASTAAWLLLT